MKEEQDGSRQISKATWFSYIESCEQSNKTQAQFCNENNLSESTFGYWCTRYLKQKKPTTLIKQCKQAALEKPLFIPVKLSQTPSKITDVIEASFNSGLSLSLPLSMPTSQIIELLKALESSHAD